MNLDKYLQFKNHQLTKLQLIQRLKDYTIYIWKALQENVEEKVPEYLEARETIMAKIDLVDIEINQINLEAHMAKGVKGQAEKIKVIEEATDIAKQSREILQEIITKDDEIWAAIEIRQRSIMKNSKGLRQGKKLSKAYGRPEYTEGVFIDRKR